MGAISHQNEIFLNVGRSNSSESSKAFIDYGNLFRVTWQLSLKILKECLLTKSPDSMNTILRRTTAIWSLNKRVSILDRWFIQVFIGAITSWRPRVKQRWRSPTRESSIWKRTIMNAVTLSTARWPTQANKKDNKIKNTRAVKLYDTYICNRSSNIFIEFLTARWLVFIFISRKTGAAGRIENVRLQVTHKTNC